MSIDMFLSWSVFVPILNSEIADNVIVPVFFDVLPTERTTKIWQEVVGAAKESVYFGTDTQKGEGSVCIYYPDFNLEEEYSLILLAMYVQLLHISVYRKGYEPGVSLGIPQDRWVVK